MAITVRLPADLHERLRERAYADRTSANQIITYALLEYLESEDERAELDGSRRRTRGADGGAGGVAAVADRA